MIREIDGDIIKLLKNEDYTHCIHGCNCFHTMGKGLALSLRKEFPGVFLEDRKTKYGDKNKLGTYSKATHILSIAPIVKKITIINAYTQFSYSNEYKVLDEKALKDVLLLIKTDFKGGKFIMPKIGCSNAGGNWEDVKLIVDEIMFEEDVTVVNYK